MSTPIFELCDQHVQRSCALDPILATYRGVAGDFGPASDYSPDGHTARAEEARDTLRQLAGLTPTGPADQLAAAHLSERLTAELAWHDSGEPLRQLRAPYGLIQSLCNSVQLMPRTNPEEWAAVTARVAAVPEMLAGWRRSLAAGLDRGAPAARRQALATAEQAQRYAVSGTFDALLAQPAGAAHGASAGESEADRLARAATAAHAALAETADWLRTSYAQGADPADGVGAERYAVAARLSLGADIDPAEAYHWGWEELRRLERELDAEADRVLTGASVDEAAAHLNRTEQVVGVDAYRGWLQEQHDRAIDQLHGVHFDIAEPLRQVDVVTLADSTAGSPYYTPPSEDLSRRGRTWWPLGGRSEFSVWAELTTVFHEGVPGHHLQLGHVLLVSETLSRYARLSRVSAHSEGWALYAERLADELGWHTAPGSRLGMLKASAMRAARVVIDIGLHLDLPIPAAEARRHGSRWTFDVALEVLRDRGRIAPHRLEPEIVRYCGWPGQAISYKLGERAWLAARADAQSRLGVAFDLKQWHTAALALGPVGLATLAETLAGE